MARTHKTLHNDPSGRQGLAATEPLAWVTTSRCSASRPLPRRALGTFVCVTGTLCAALAIGGVAAAAGSVTARVSRSLTIRDTAVLHLVSSNANVRDDAGRASGTLPGQARLTITQSGSKISGTEIFYVNGGSIRLRGNGTLHIGRGVYASFSGTATVIGGTGRYKRASGSGKFYGAENRFTHSATVQSIGSVNY
jgi:hypothetical protein